MRLTETAGVRGCGCRGPASVTGRAPGAASGGPALPGWAAFPRAVVPPWALTGALRQPRQRMPAASGLIQLQMGEFSKIKFYMFEAIFCLKIHF